MAELYQRNFRLHCASSWQGQAIHASLSGLRRQLKSYGFTLSGSALTLRFLRKGILMRRKCI